MIQVGRLKERKSEAATIQGDSNQSSQACRFTPSDFSLATFSLHPYINSLKSMIEGNSVLAPGGTRELPSAL
jgi:hypothetical protein